MLIRLLLGVGLAAVLTLSLVLGVVHFTGGEAEAQVPPIGECLQDCLDANANFDGQNGFTLDDIYRFVEAYERQEDVCDAAYPCDYDGDGDIDVFDIVAYAGKVRDCFMAQCLPTP